MANAPIGRDSARDNCTDTILEQAWTARQAAYGRYNALPFSEVPGAAYTPEETAEWAIIDQAELTIRSAVASTTNGAAIQLWVALQHRISKGDDESAVLRRDLDWFADDERHDWTDRLILSALRSLKAMEAGHGRD